MKANNKVMISNFMLIFASVIWGSNFIVQKVVAADIGPFLFMSVRSLLGSLTMVPIVLLLEKRTAPENRAHYDRRTFFQLLRTAFLCGVINVTGSVLVQWGLIYTTASKAGFLNAIYIIFVPVVGLLFFKKTPNRFMWLGIVLATVGLYSLCLNETLTINPGDLIILGSTLFFSVHIHLISRFVHEFNGVHLVCLEFFFASLYCLVCSLLIEEPSLRQIAECRFSILFSGVLGIGICYILQVTAQKYTDPTIAALLMSLEAVFGALGGVLILHESFTLRELIGVLFIVAAVIIAQLNPKAKTSADCQENHPKKIPPV